MGKAVFKDLIKQIKNTFSRFLAIFAIVVIGVAFFTGVSASSNDMKYSTDCYYDEYNLMDLRLFSSIGFDEEDIKRIQSVEGIKGVYGAFFVDALVDKYDIESVAHIMSIPENTDSDNENYINQLRIKEGRLPQSKNECVVKVEDTKDNFSIGDKIQLKSGNDKELTESLSDTEYTVVGLVYAPNYISYELGSSTIGNGRVSYIVYIQNSAFTMPVYSEVYVTVNGAKELDTYSEEYKSKIDNANRAIGKISKERLEARKEGILSIYNAAVEEALKQAKQVVYDHVVYWLTEQYQNMYVGMDVSDLIEPYIESTYQEELKKYDFKDIYDQSNKQFQDNYGNPDEWSWTILTREELYSYKDYETSAERMKNIALVFPAFFVLVAALVALTTMTRMVEEERGIAGIYKALGYSKAAILFKYIMYAFLASILGGVVGSAVGLRVFPKVIYDSWNIIYQLPAIKYDSHIVLAIVATVIVSLACVFVTIAACNKELEESPSQLLRPKSPKKGKKIFLEHIGIIWNHISFTKKVTFRNLLLYKKRFFMTVIGIAGCSALIVAGFGIKDSVESIADNQFKELLKYDGVILLKDNLDVGNILAIQEELANDSNIADCYLQYGYTTDVKIKDNDFNVNYVVVNKDKFEDFYSLRKRTDKSPIELTDDGVVISEKLAKDNKLSIGDTIPLANINGLIKDAKITGITEMYIGHYVFASSDYYDQKHGNEYSKNQILVKFKNDDSDLGTEFGKKYIANNNVKNVDITQNRLTRFVDMVDSLKLVTWVLIISAGALALVVLYNLTNINIAERRREIATIKVLGFYNREVASYVFRENLILTIIGGIVGLGLGRLLHLFIMTTVEMEAVMFGFKISPSSYLIAFGITIIYSILVNIIMYPSLKRLPMIESLKSVE